MLKKWINEPKAIREEGNLIEIVAGSKNKLFCRSSFRIKVT